MAKKKLEQVKLVVGDWSNDGHGRTSETNILVNCSGEKLEESYEKGVKIVGFDLSEDVCSEYEDYHIYNKELMLLKEHGLDIEELEDHDGGDEGSIDSACLGTDGFVAVWLFIASLGFKALTGKDLVVDYSVDMADEINIGGYGLFS